MDMADSEGPASFRYWINTAGAEPGSARIMDPVSLGAPDPIVAEVEAHPQGRKIPDGQLDFPDNFER
ncbi:MAG: hypothetical protein A3J97_05085 [Spirochaetes bacterium RIFOXYC1_FULL_54_7]|nr:MAG: hypothetical protein A3J97_05085 [Spirochaetes bacterium RIFOXYC1_FULL_54_7]